MNGLDLLINSGVERRYVPAELRVDGDGRIEGYAAIFSQLSVDLGGFRERVRPGAFTKTLNEADIRGLFNHDPNYVLGRNRAGTLELAEDAHGLHFRANPPATTWAADLRETIRRRDVDQGSFGFGTIRDDWQIVDGIHERDLIEVRLFDVSVVTFPAYPATAVNVRALAGGFVRHLAESGVENDVVLELIDQLRGIAANAPGGGAHPLEEDAAAIDFSLMRQRLALLEL